MSSHTEGPRLGITVSPHIPARDFVPYVHRIEQLGFHEAWLVEDCFLHGAFAQAGTRIGVALGRLQVAAVVRGPARRLERWSTCAGVEGPQGVCLLP